MTYIFGSCGQIGVRWCSQCSYDVIICGGPLGDAPSIGVLCSVYKARCCRNSGLGKKQVSLRHKRTKATQQDLNNHILLCRTNGMGPTPTPNPRNGPILSPVRQVTILHLVAPNGFFPGVVVTCEEERGTRRFPVGERKGKMVFGEVVSGLMEKVVGEDASHWEDSVLTMQ